MRLSDFKVLTFDCYGTLIDWESGLYAALQPLLRAMNTRPGARRRWRSSRSRGGAAGRDPCHALPELLAEVHRRLARQWGVTRAAEDHAAFGLSVHSGRRSPTRPQHCNTSSATTSSSSSRTSIVKSFAGSN